MVDVYIYIYIYSDDEFIFRISDDVLFQFAKREIIGR